MFPPIFVVLHKHSVVAGSFILVEFTLIGNIITTPPPVSHFVQEIMTCSLVDNLTIRIQRIHFFVFPVREWAAHWYLALNTTLVEWTDLPHDILFLVFIDFYTCLESDWITPHEHSKNPVITNPTLLILLRKHLPLARSWNVLLVADPAL